MRRAGAIERDVAGPMNLSLEDAAAAVISIATENMVQAIIDITVNQASTPRGGADRWRRRRGSKLGCHRAAARQRARADSGGWRGTECGGRDDVGPTFPVHADLLCYVPKTSTLTA